MAALNAAAELDVDLNPEESQFLASEKSLLETVLDNMLPASSSTLLGSERQNKNLKFLQQSEYLCC